MTIQQPDKNAPVLDQQGKFTFYWFGWLNKLVQIVNGLMVGVSVTVVTAKLTPGGTAGSLTYTNGRLTAQVPAT
jgi:hypothetical protein